jgi:hypothetical protein
MITKFTNETDINNIDMVKVMAVDFSARSSQGLSGMQMGGASHMLLFNATSNIEGIL